MGARSRKRGRTTQAAGSTRADGPRVATTGPLPGEAPLSRAQKTEARNEAVRRKLEPLREGERPPWVTYGAILAATLGVLNIGLYAAGVRVADGTAAGTVGVGLVLLLAAGGMWRAKYWAVLGFEVLLGTTTAFAALSLLVASSVKGALIAVVVTGVSGTFFWKLIRAMARIQMPERPGPRNA